MKGTVNAIIFVVCLLGIQYVAAYPQKYNEDIDEPYDRSFRPNNEERYYEEPVDETEPVEGDGLSNLERQLLSRLLDEKANKDLSKEDIDRLADRGPPKNDLDEPSLSDLEDYMRMRAANDFSEDKSQFELGMQNDEMAKNNFYPGYKRAGEDESMNAYDRFLHDDSNEGYERDNFDANANNFDDDANGINEDDMRGMTLEDYERILHENNFDNGNDLQEKWGFGARSYDGDSSDEENDDESSENIVDDYPENDDEGNVRSMTLEQYEHEYENDDDDERMLDNVNDFDNANDLREENEEEDPEPDVTDNDVPDDSERELLYKLLQRIEEKKANGEADEEDLEKDFNGL